MKTRLLGAVALVAIQGAPAGAETIEETAAAFGAMPTVRNISLSPSGDRLVYIRSGGFSTENIYQVDLAGDGVERLVLSHPDPDSEISWCVWGTDERLVCEASATINRSGRLVGVSRLFALDPDGKNVVQLSAEQSSRALIDQQHGGSILALELEGKPGQILMARAWSQERTIGSRLGKAEGGVGVEEVSLKDGKRRVVESPDDAIVDYAADEKGRVRIKVRQERNSKGYLEDKREYYYRTPDSNAWKQFSSNEDFYPVAVDSARNVAYGFAGKEGFQAAVAISLDGTGASETLLARGDVDVDSYIRIGRKRRIVGISYATDMRDAVFLDDEYKALTERFRKALPGKPSIGITGASQDETKLILVASSDTDPGMTYLYDKKTRELGELLPLREELLGREMGAMRPFTYPAGDGTSIPGYLTLPPGSAGKNLPTIVMPHGGPSSRDEWGFDWLVQFFVARGYAVLQPNYRGSSGFGDEWFGQNGFKSWETAIGDVNDAGRWLVNEGIADPARLVIVGWSYGGYAALQSQVVDNALYKSVVAIAPVTDLEALREEARGFISYDLVDSFVGRGPHIEAGSPARHAAKFASPVMLVHGTIDQNVGVDQSRLMKRRLEENGKYVSYIEFEARDHYMDDEWSRTKMLTEIAGFLARTVGQ